MTPELLADNTDVARLAEIHASSFPKPWTEHAFLELLAMPGTFAFLIDGGFILARVAEVEAEILTIAVDPAYRKQGVGTALVRFAADHAHRLGADRMVLEVAIGNVPANGLYSALGFAKAGQRKNYYALGQGKFEDALILYSNLPLSALGNQPISG